MWGGIVDYEYTPEHATRQLQALIDFTTVSGNGEDDHATIGNVYFFNQTAAMSIEDIIAGRGDSVKQSVCRLGSGGLRRQCYLASQINDLTQAAFRDIKPKGTFTFSNYFQPIPRSITNKTAANGGNVLGLDGTEDLKLNFGVSYTDSADDELMNAATVNMTNNYVEFTKSVNEYRKPVYMN
ncbi:MAG: hypothetical protein M1835_005658 [Candelina submexicana]|nr:MAG: hypothetical protein M1835_005658 [Candelina submexicana]